MKWLLSLAGLAVIAALLPAILGWGEGKDTTAWRE
jgi:hypothetical protein